MSTLEQTIGNTPLVKLQRMGPDNGSEVWLKLEGNNPAGSVKDRAALSMIVEAEKRGEIKPGDVLIEATSGNTGIALAMIAALKGYRMKLLMPDNMSQERRAAMRAYGADGLCGNCRIEQVCATLGSVLKSKKIYLLERFTVFFIRLNMQR